MSEAKPNHTSLPWKFRASYSNGEPRGYVVESGIKVIADLCCSPEDLSVEVANARLIAAAPELLEACEFALKYCEQMRKETGDVIPGDNCRTLRAAIARAKGNQ